MSEQSGEKTNLELLVEAGVLDASEMSDEAKRVVNEEMGSEEVQSLITSHKRFPNNPPYKPQHDGAGF
jgi:hypothetical protein